MAPTDWRRHVRESLLAGLASPPSSEDADAAVQQVLHARTELQQALHERSAGSRPRPSEVKTDSKIKARALRRAVDVVRQMADERYPKELCDLSTFASGARSGARRPGIGDYAFVARQRSEAAVKVFEAFADDLDASAVAWL